MCGGFADLLLDRALEIFLQLLVLSLLVEIRKYRERRGDNGDGRRDAADDREHFIEAFHK